MSLSLPHRRQQQLQHHSLFTSLRSTFFLPPLTSSTSSALPSSLFAPPSCLSFSLADRVQEDTRHLLETLWIQNRVTLHSKLLFLFDRIEVKIKQVKRDEMKMKSTEKMKIFVSDEVTQMWRSVCWLLLTLSRVTSPSFDLPHLEEEEEEDNLTEEERDNREKRERKEDVRENEDEDPLDWRDSSTNTSSTSELLSEVSSDEEEEGGVLSSGNETIEVDVTREQAAPSPSHPAMKAETETETRENHDPLFDLLFSFAPTSTSLAFDSEKRAKQKEVIAEADSEEWDLWKVVIAQLRHASSWFQWSPEMNSYQLTDSAASFARSNFYSSFLRALIQHTSHMKEIVVLLEKCASPLDNKAIIPFHRLHHSVSQHLKTYQDQVDALERDCRHHAATSGVASLLLVINEWLMLHLRRSSFLYALLVRCCSISTSEQASARLLDTLWLLWWRVYMLNDHELSRLMLSLFVSSVAPWMLLIEQWTKTGVLADTSARSSFFIIAVEKNNSAQDEQRAEYCLEMERAPLFLQPCASDLFETGANVSLITAMSRRSCSDPVLDEPTLLQNMLTSLSNYLPSDLIGELLQVDDTQHSFFDDLVYTPAQEDIFAYEPAQIPIFSSSANPPVSSPSLFYSLLYQQCFRARDFPELKPLKPTKRMYVDPLIEKWQHPKSSSDQPPPTSHAHTLGCSTQLQWRFLEDNLLTPLMHRCARSRLMLLQTLYVDARLTDYQLALQDFFCLRDWLSVKAFFEPVFSSLLSVRIDSESMLSMVKEAITSPSREISFSIRSLLLERMEVNMNSTKAFSPISPLLLLSSVHFSLNMPWPLSSVINVEAVGYYNSILHVQLQCRLAKLAVHSARQRLFRAKRSHSPLLRRLCLFLHKLNFFVECFCSHLAEQAASSFWHMPSEIANIDAVRVSLYTHLVHVMSACLLSLKLRTALQASLGILQLALDVGKTVTTVLQQIRMDIDEVEDVLVADEEEDKDLLQKKEKKRLHRLSLSEREQRDMLLSFQQKCSRLEVQAQHELSIVEHQFKNNLELVLRMLNKAVTLSSVSLDTQQAWLNLLRQLNCKHFLLGADDIDSNEQK